ncbi:uncharacterized protein LOC131204695 [Ahaetulla prasina]|uniref:uncharacterized protein LOC131204695 n=1 Tax=Ahaetulla prasina TaxID=499056 RepID=UPI002649DE8E|nr:uncharacterized protein LOC131204695 [Ahaetulla prasina]
MMKASPEATFTPTAAGLRPRETQGPEMDDQMKRMISEAIAQGIAAGLQQRQQAAPAAPETPLHQDQCVASQHQRDLFQGSHSTPSSMQSKLSLSDEDQKEMELSEYEGMAPPPPARLFRPALFKSLLLKAKAAAHLGADSATTESALNPSELLFSEPVAEKEEIPSPKLFQDVVQRQWAQPGVLPPPSGTDKRFYNMAPDFLEILQSPTIDDPVAALTSILSSEDGLKPEDKKAEVALRNMHQAAAWAIRAATAASFFNRASLLWLRQMQARVPPSDLRFHQDINKLVAAMEFSADATLDAARFASKAIASSVVARRLLWLRYWQADTKFKWKLATAPYKGSKVFGEVLEPILTETKDGRKVLPSLYKQADRRPSPYFSRPSFQPKATGFNTPQSQRAYAHRQDQQPDRSGFRDRNRQYFQGKQPFRGTGNRAFRHSN